MNEEGLWIDVLIDLCVNICSSISIVVSKMKVSVGIRPSS